jgi:hypothetical protein
MIGLMREATPAVAAAYRSIAANATAKRPV